LEEDGSDIGEEGSRSEVRLLVEFQGEIPAEMNTLFLRCAWTVEEFCNGMI
jgi:hypothetical protein